ncbi:hypothetical protein RJ639_014311 [Escallonia herrerae]|uniref:Uncharacterized protein n=1 Tax=Escallonia herrerae TaxID=1293975 RepID=A0AA88VGH6_9ASTE|nr:hypothetical protein RJ639_014311 [Escallonia herrerae]
MAIFKSLQASVLISLLVFHLTVAEDMIVEQHALPGASYLQGRTCARGPVGLAVPVATACLRVLQATRRFVPVTIP